ncbi:MAG: 3-deoxy-8-phosphooctulonate synthase [Candidatus Omnitrophota bacterium]
MKENDCRTHRNAIHRIKLSDFTVGGDSPLFLIAGPCVVEDLAVCLEIAGAVKEACSKRGVNYIFKASFDKANKTIKGSYRGPGWEKGLDILSKVKAKENVLILSDVHEKEQCKPAAEICDLLQIPALLSKQIDLILQAARTGRPVNIKKGQFTAPWEMGNVVGRLKDEGFKDILVTERGAMFGYQQLVSDMRSLVALERLLCPVIFDASHSVCGNAMIAEKARGSNRDFILPLCRSAAACGIDGLFLEVHPDPDKARSDSVGTYPLGDIGSLLDQVVAIDSVLSRARYNV